MKSIDLIEDLSNANGISGFEDEVLEVIRDYVGDDLMVKEDKLRNLYLYHKNFDKTKPVLMLDGHSDEIGFMVKSINKNGTLKFITIGGWYSQNVLAHKVRIRNKDGKYVKGIVASKPPHFMTDEEKNKVIKINEMVIDIGAVNREEVLRDYRIEAGAPIIPDVEFEYDEDREIMTGKAFDNRLGTACVVEIMKELKDDQLDINIVGALSAQEEVGTRGAEITARTVKPDLAVVFEGTPADDTFKDEYDAQAKLKSGPQIRHIDVSVIASPRFTKFARRTAKKNDIPFQDAVRVGGGNDGGKIALSSSGIPTIIIGVPARYAHTHYGISSFEDYKNTVRWSTEIIKALNRDVISSF
ncbi:putative aminopeptidase FrvX [Halanaerobium sp. DL-01]|uniref:M42 family metallopeptidase n=1 Tax=Halanaerobium sp. DL-01 TaxID=1653064 RepID=UPI000DF35027|nr:M42 family peptidase [Halanaerobium sp. DL-01]RCW83479.1 putative aminopeptidase FrvX [Halanaerobium sp. DL-01]